MSKHTHTVKSISAGLSQTSSVMLSALSAISIGVSIWDKNFCLVMANKKFYDIFGLSADDVPVGMDYREFVQAACDNGSLEGRTPDDIAEETMSLISRGTAVTWEDEWPDGRFFAVEQHPNEDGGWIATYQDITNERKATARLTFLEHHDPLTSLPNRTSFIQKVEEALSRRQSIGVMIIDLNHVEDVNMKLGHPTGDSLLKMVASRLAKIFRRIDTVARIGGDQFGVLLARTKDAEQTLECAKSLIPLLRQAFDIDGQRIRVSAHIGAATAPYHGKTADALLSNANLALQTAKRTHAPTCLFHQGLADKIEARHILEADLRLAVKGGQLRLFYQPLVDSRTGRVAGFEALMRWEHPKRGMISPGEFIPVAEATGLIIPMGAWALKQACLDAACWPEYTKVAVNLSALQLKSDDIYADILAALQASRLNPERLEVEITESLLITDTDTTRDLIKQLRQMGVQIAMDDFGTGYSSLSYLRDFDFDKIKIDKSFVDRIGQNTSDEAVVRAVMHLASDLGVKTVAEGVETEEQKEFLQNEGCTYLQGYLFSKPRPARDVEGLIATIGAPYIVRYKG